MTRSGVRRTVRHAPRWVGSQLTAARLLAAAKAALAVAIAWTVAGYLPGVANEYPYYAPLGALVSMYPTLMSSVRNSLQTLGGLFVAIVLAGAVLLVSGPNVLTISLAVGVGALVAATGVFGANREYIPVTALFVLIIGGPNADGYSIGYLEQVSLGIVIGLAVNLLILPPLTLDAVGRQLSHYRGRLAGHLSDLAEALTENWPPERDDWASRGDELIRLVRDVHDALFHAEDSRKGNPRARIHRRDLASDRDDLAALETVTFHVRDLTDVLAGVAWGAPIALELHPELRPPLARALLAVAAVLTEWESGRDGDAVLTDSGAFETAETAVAQLTAELDTRHDATPATAMGAATAISLDLTRILAALRPRLARTAT
ncbi:MULTISPECIES: aromatic acid exporter family protein [unclassified Cryobacterium]|uniref:FUSC family protein n=1 Tax=unclassified Cryobacterium TaxID=2649013 RepID=UPI00106D090B|nr:MULTISPECIES: FUSC family protein [unclassified Cryobacterium]MDY7529886.1 FUSC family protein [Cryobacterium sp. 10C2]MEB0004664.1 FUSC family protein [Cryobacterium sp. RTC2.1]MEB0202973.1 FUSC family protein [Cryobacterium sp. 5I3]MEB0287546.1 FUSC family protein [Cryobacterium sp. 10S3]MEB0292443.1 FUSC family protein [Cryobacterium sp. 10C2]